MGQKTTVVAVCESEDKAKKVQRLISKKTDCPSMLRKRPAVDSDVALYAELKNLVDRCDDDVETDDLNQTIQKMEEVVCHG